MQRERENSKSLKSRKEFCHPEDSHKEISGYIKRNLADDDRRICNMLHSHSGESSSQGGTGEGTEKGLPTESQQLLGGERTVPGPQHIRK